MLILNDGIAPTNPSNLRVTNLSNDYLYISWDRSYSYDFDSYIIELGYENNGDYVCYFYDRDTSSKLAWQKWRGRSRHIPI